MKTPRDLGGRELADGLCRHWAYRVVGQTGSHIILQTEDPSHQRIPVPAHRALRVGTLNASVRLVANHKRVSRQAIPRITPLNRQLRFLFALKSATLFECLPENRSR
jgi:hypothetical protein